VTDAVGPRAARRRAVRRYLPFVALAFAAVLIAVGSLTGLGTAHPAGPATSEQALRNALLAEQKVFITEQAFADSVVNPAVLDPVAALSWVQSGETATDHPEHAILAVVPGADTDPSRAANPNAVVLTTEGHDGRCYSVAEINLTRPGTGPAGTYYRIGPAGTAGCRSPRLPTGGPGGHPATDPAYAGQWEAAW
jgi:hypothetical protein